MSIRAEMEELLEASAGFDGFAEIAKYVGKKLGLKDVQTYPSSPGSPGDHMSMTLVDRPRWKETVNVTVEKKGNKYKVSGYRYEVTSGTPGAAGQSGHDEWRRDRESSVVVDAGGVRAAALKVARKAKG